MDLPAVEHIDALYKIGVINSPDYWRASNIQWTGTLFEKAAASGGLDRQVENGISSLLTALDVLAGAGIVNTPGYWLEKACEFEYVKLLLLNIGNRARTVLEKIIHAEARGEPFEGQVLVGNVIMNRCKNPRFPNGIYNVVFQPGQFTPVTNGAYEAALPSESVKMAVNAVLSGHDNSKGALYFCTKKSAELGNWHEKALTFLFEVGNHRFYC